MNDDPIPLGLRRYLANSELRVVAWNGARLKISVNKEIGGERGWLVFNEVSQVNLPPALEIEAIEVDALPSDFFDAYRPCDDRRLEPGETAFILHGSGGERFFVIAESIAYTVDDSIPGPDLTP